MTCCVLHTLSLFIALYHTKSPQSIDLQLVYSGCLSFSYECASLPHRLRHEYCNSFITVEDYTEIGQAGLEISKNSVPLSLGSLLGLFIVVCALLLTTYAESIINLKYENPRTELMSKTSKRRRFSPANRGTMACDGSLRYPPMKPSSDSFRLLKLLPGRRNGQICCNLFSASVRRQHNKYTALSYAWGPPILAQNIIVNGYQHPIRKNLYAFLESCTARKDFRVFWIDAICINQADVSEKNHQVGIMGKIFEKAIQVYAWLGHGSYDSDWYLGYLSRYSAEGMVRYLDKSTTSAKNQLRFEQGREWIISRFYWSRIWIVQELLLAKTITVICGKKSVHWDRLDELEDISSPHRLPYQDEDEAPLSLHEKIWGQYNLPRQSQFLHSPFEALRQSRKMKTTHRNLEALLRQFGEMECQVPHDHVYALVGLIREPHSDAKPNIDYSAPLHEVLCEVLGLIKHREPVMFTQYLARILHWSPDGLFASTDNHVKVTLRLPRLGLVPRSEVMPVGRVFMIMDDNEQNPLNKKEPWRYIFNQYERRNMEGFAVTFPPDKVFPGDPIYHIDISPFGHKTDQVHSTVLRVPRGKVGLLRSNQIVLGGLQRIAERPGFYVNIYGCGASDIAAKFVQNAACSIDADSTDLVIETDIRSLLNLPGSLLPWALISKRSGGYIT